MEKVYMEVPKKNSRMWKPEDISPYDFKDDIPVNTTYDQYSDTNEEEYDMEAIMDELNRIDDELESDCIHEDDMYDNGNIDWRCNEDVSQTNERKMSVDRKTIVEEDNPKRKTTTWMRVTKYYK